MALKERIEKLKPYLLVYNVSMEDGVQYAVGNLVTDLVGMSFGDGFGSKDSFLHVQSYLSL